MRSSRRCGGWISQKHATVADVIHHGLTYYCRPMLRQRLAATDREHPLAEVMKNTRCHRYFRLSNPAHNGLVGGSNPPGPTTQSYATGDFLKVYERPRIGGDRCDGSFLETAPLQSGGHFCAFFSGPEIPFPGNGDRARQRLGSNAG